MTENYAFSLAGMPCLVSAGWLNALAGGKQVMQLAGALPETKPLATVNNYRLNISDGTNPSAVVHNGHLLVCVRVPQANVLGEIAGRGVISATPVMVPAPLLSSPRDFNPWRLYSLAGHLGAVACYADYGVKGTPHAQIALVQLAGGIATGFTILPSTRYEKNWMPCVDGDSLRLVYCVDPLVVLDTPYKAGDHLPMGGKLRGSSQLIPYGNGWLGIVHQTHLTQTGPVYLHRFVQFRADLGAAWWGRPWHLQKQGVEIVAGLAYFGGQYIVSYGTDDMTAQRAAWIAHVTPETVEEMLKEG